MIILKQEYKYRLLIASYVYGIEQIDMEQELGLRN